MALRSPGVSKQWRSRPAWKASVQCCCWAWAQRASRLCGEAAEQGVGRVRRRGFVGGRLQGPDVHQLGQIVEVGIGRFDHRHFDAFVWLAVSSPACLAQGLLVGFAQALEACGVVVRTAALEQPRIAALDGALVGIFGQLQYVPILHRVLPQRQKPLSNCSS